MQQQRKKKLRLKKKKEFLGENIKEGFYSLSLSLIFAPKVGNKFLKYNILNW